MKEGSVWVRPRIVILRYEHVTVKHIALCDNQHIYFKSCVPLGPHAFLEYPSRKDKIQSSGSKWA